MTFAPALEAMRDGRHGCRDAGIRRDLAVLDRHVEVGANEDALSRKVEIGKTLERHNMILESSDNGPATFRAKRANFGPRPGAGVGGGGQKSIAPLILMIGGAANAS
jgi:hypothetical protein